MGAGSSDADANEELEVAVRNAIRKAKKNAKVSSR
jgi:hypothetical protein